MPSGSPTIPDQIVQDRTAYFEALEAADESWKRNILDLSKMEILLETLLARQLKAFFESVGGKMPSDL